MTLSTQLDRYADELNSGRWRQIRQQRSDERGGKCALGVWDACGLDYYDLAGDLTMKIVDEVHRITPDSWRLNSISSLNDTGRIPFSVFAQAARTVAWRERLKEQEQSYGAPIVVAEAVTT